MDNSITNNNLAVSLDAARRVAKKAFLIQSSELERSHRERLVALGYLEEIIRGWYMLTTPAGKGTTTLWYSSYWDFIKVYLQSRFEDDYCLSAENSLDVHSALNLVPEQLVVLTKKSSNQTLTLPFGTSIIFYQERKNYPRPVIAQNNLNIMTIAEALTKASPAYFFEKTMNCQICLKLASVSEISRYLVESRSVTVAQRVIGAFKGLGSSDVADALIKDMNVIGLSVRPANPFNRGQVFLKGKSNFKSSYSARIESLWAKMRGDVIDVFPEKMKKVGNNNQLKIIERLYNQDAYHSLSIEGYQVTESLIERIKNGTYNPDKNTADLQLKNVLAAKGYHLAFKTVTNSIKKILDGKDPGKIFSDDLQTWYRELFTPLVQSQIIRSGDIAGYRNGQVYITGSRHVPPPASAVIDSMETLERLLIEEENALVRAILGHFIFVFIHPYMDGNGRIGRFLLNLMLISGGYSWTVIRVTERAAYMSSLEEASVKGKYKTIR